MALEAAALGGFFGRKMDQTPTCERLHCRVPDGRPAFSLVELLAVVAILGMLVAISLPAVQASRESTRRAVCGSNLRQTGIAILGHELARRTFPPGNEALTGRNHAWSSFILPYLDAAPIAARINYAVPWNHPENIEIADAVIPSYVCPSGIVRYAGKQDYGGVMGTALLLSEDATRPPGWEHGGILYATSDACRRPCRAAEVTDGLSQTLLVSEAVDRGFADVETHTRIGNALWACGTNCFLHNAPVLNIPDVDAFRSNHIGGVHALFGDARVSFLADRTDPVVLMAICTKAGGDVISETP